MPRKFAQGITQLWAAGLMMMWVGGSVQATPIVDQSQLDGTDQNQAVHSTRTVGQTFTAGTSGLLTAVELSLFELGAGPGLDVAVLDFSGGDLSTAPVLGSVSIDESELGPSPTTLDLTTVTATLIDLSSLGILVNAGDALALELSSDRVLTNGSPLFAVRIAFNDPYSGGGYFVNSVFATIGGVGVDAAFKTFVEPAGVPAPGTVALFGLGWVLLASRLGRLK